MRVTIEHSIDVSASPEIVWTIFREIDAWPCWNRTLQHTHFVQGNPWTPNSVFTMALRLCPALLTAKITIDTSDPPRSVSWRGARFGVRSHHVWSFDYSGEVTRVLSRETFVGPTLPLLWLGGMPLVVGCLSKFWLERLKAASEGATR